MNMEILTKNGPFLISNEDYPIISKYNWNIDKENYVIGSIDNKRWRLHRYIMIIILKHNITSSIPIDHIDNNPLNNTRDNLRLSTHLENARNRKKKINSSSKYIGVSFSKEDNLWVSRISYNSKTISAYYNNESHAGHHYNLWCKEYCFTTAKLNDINKDELNDFILWKPKQITKTLPKNITLTKSNTYCVILKGKYIGTFKTLDEGILELNKEKNKIEYIKDIKNPINFNNDSLPVIFLYNKKGVKVEETIVDENIYYDLIKYKWYIVRNKYVSAMIDTKNIRLHRFITECNDTNLVVDHINGNTFDNRKENLRIVTHQQNSMNKRSSKNASSKYIGVCWNKLINKWVANIKVNKKNKFLGNFDNEIDAAECRDKATIEYYKEFGNLNFKV